MTNFRYLAEVTCPSCKKTGKPFRQLGITFICAACYYEWYDPRLSDEPAMIAEVERSQSIKDSKA